jgi:hypothetical protein
MRAVSTWNLLLIGLPFVVSLTEARPGGAGPTAPAP